jgi:hypothetical protein
MILWLCVVVGVGSDRVMRMRDCCVLVTLVFGIQVGEQPSFILMLVYSKLDATQQCPKHRRC